VCDEARTLLRLNHPSPFPGFALFLSEFLGRWAVIRVRNCSGRSLSEVFGNGVLTGMEKNKAIVSRAKGVAFLHGRKGLQRDPKPKSVLFDWAGRHSRTAGSARVAEPGATRRRLGRPLFTVHRTPLELGSIGGVGSPVAEADASSWLRGSQRSARSRCRILCRGRSDLMGGELAEGASPVMKSMRPDEPWGLLGQGPDEASDVGGFL
jgi:serine/threonine protein kinase